MVIETSKLKRTLVKIVATLQIGVGVLLLSGTIALTLTAYKTVRDESEQLVENLSATTNALESLRISYEQSAENLFAMTVAMDDVAEKLVEVSESVTETGKKFVEYGYVEKPSFFNKLKPFTEWFRNSGEKLKEVGGDVVSVSAFLNEQSKIIKAYRSDGHAKTMLAMAETIESLHHVMQRLKDSDRSAVHWCGFVCILGFCVSMLFFTNGLLLCFVNRLGYTASPALTSAIGRD